MVVDTVALRENNLFNIIKNVEKFSQKQILKNALATKCEFRLFLGRYIEIWPQNQLVKLTVKAKNSKVLKPFGQIKVDEIKRTKQLPIIIENYQRVFVKLPTTKDS